MKYKLISLLVLALIFAAIFSCNQNEEEKEINENELGIVNANVISTEEHFDTVAQYVQTEPGESKRFMRSFENAPPLIPHTTNGFFPIKKDNNICLSCHLPNLVEASGAIAIPESHFTNLRPQPKLEGELYSVTDELLIDYGNEINNQYFNCSQCHVPQANVKIDIKNK